MNALCEHMPRNSLKTTWVRENAFKKGEPNMTSAMFCEYVNNHLLPNHHLVHQFPRTISLRTAVRWLHQLGFKPVSHKKVFISMGMSEKML